MWRLMNNFDHRLYKLSRQKLQSLARRRMPHMRTSVVRRQSTQQGESTWISGENEKPQRQLRWGIAPINILAEDFVTATTTLPPEKHRITACMGTYRSQALEFADRYKVPNVFTSFEDLARCPDVDAVYISPLNCMHCELCHLMLNHDKHVLCEQPLCMAEQQVVQLVTKAKARGLFLMEGVWSRCLPSYEYMRSEIAKSKLGVVYDVRCRLGWELPNAQTSSSAYAGVTRNWAADCIQLALWIYQEVPMFVRVDGKLNDAGVDIIAEIELSFRNNRRAVLELSAEKNLANMATIRGTKDCIIMNNFWSPTLLFFNNREVEFKLPTTECKTYFDSRVGMCYEIEEARKCILNGRTESKLFNHSESQLMVNLIDQITDMMAVKDKHVKVQRVAAIQ
ncbi:trans-1,2-dihydrobenzene-1,2-diol dehydrogenase [Drosophila hydei]|uniref:Trans-1,2-dihydrobenzene-1,2-diol dehydrogenase n=1 Tax=Drosophila hydei TaxID=7224 RepID=A0A6J1M334_DROHY|nr:trans-1,2-dihydrobenzene-1,2-diol dehydrogenase [Drosophila hydei]